MVGNRLGGKRFNRLLSVMVTSLTAVVTRVGSAVTCASSKRGRCLKSTTHTGTANVAGARFVLVTVVLFSAGPSITLFTWTLASVNKTRRTVSACKYSKYFCSFTN